MIYLKGDIPAGRKIDSSSVEVRKVKGFEVPDNAMSETEAVGRVVKHKMSAGSVVTEADLSPAKTESSPKAVSKSHTL